MSQLCQRVVLVHELRQLRTSEELSYRCGYRTNVNQLLRGSIFIGHAFPYRTFHSGESDTELVLKQFTHGLQTTVAQVVDIVHFTQSVVQVQQVADGCDDVRKDDVLRRKLVLPAGNCRLQIILGLRIVNDILQHRVVNQLRQLVRCQVDVHVSGRIHELVSDNLSDGTIILVLAAD